MNSASVNWGAAPGSEVHEIDVPRKWGETEKLVEEIVIKIFNNLINTINP